MFTMLAQNREHFNRLENLLQRYSDDGFVGDDVVFEVEGFDGRFEAIGFVAVVAAVVPSIDVVIPLQMGLRLVQLLAQTAERQIGHFSVIVMRPGSQTNPSFKI